MKSNYRDCEGATRLWYERATERACACASASARLMEDVFDNL